MQPSGCIFLHHRPSSEGHAVWDGTVLKAGEGGGGWRCTWPVRPVLTRWPGSPVPSRRSRAPKGRCVLLLLLVTTVHGIKAPDNQVSLERSLRQCGRGSIGGQSDDGRHPPPLRVLCSAHGAAPAKPVDAVSEGMLRMLCQSPCRSPGKQCSPGLDEQVHQSGV